MSSAARIQELAGKAGAEAAEAITEALTLTSWGDLSLAISAAEKARSQVDVMLTRLREAHAFGSAEATERAKREKP